MVKVAYTVGRFQPPTIGHKMLIQAVIDAAGEDGEAYVFVSAVDPDGVKNFLTAEQKLPILRDMFAGKNVVFVHTKKDCLPVENCGGPYAAFRWLTTVKEHRPEDITFVIGKERLDRSKIGTNEYFGPENRAWGDTIPRTFMPVGESAIRDMDAPANDANNMSGTKARGYVVEDNSKKADFYTAMGYDFTRGPNPAVEDAYVAIYRIKFKDRGVKRPRRGGATVEEEDTVPEGPDGEPATGGRHRRKTRRVKRNKALARTLYRRGSRSRNGSSKTNRSSYGFRGY